MVEQEKIDNLLREIGQPYPRCGFYIGTGWFPVVETALKAMASVPISWQLTQVKEKFCGLRIYYDIDERVDADDPNAKICSEKIDQIIAQAEHECNTMCESCGAPHGLSVPRAGQALCQGCRLPQSAIKEL